MKKIITLLAALTLAVSALAQDGLSLYNKFSDRKGVSAIYVSPAMFRLFGKLPDVAVGEDEVNFASIIRSLSGFYMLETEDPAIGNDLRHDFDKMIRKGKAELLMEVKEDGEVSRFFTVGDEKTVRSLMMLTGSGSETAVITLDGNMLREDLEKLLAEAAESE